VTLGRDSSCFSEGVSEAIKAGNYTMVARDVVFHDNNDNHLCKYNHKCVFTDNCRQPQGGKEVVIGSDVWIGRGAKILSGVTIGDGAIIGAWTVVSKDVPAFAVVVGSPMVIKRFRFTKEQIAKLEKLKWWEWEADVVNQRRDDMLDIETFLEKYA
jgi:virginiamycin A acetyltransferase